MFYANYKNEVLESYKRAINVYNDSYEATQREIRRLYERRKNSIQIILKIEALINSLVNSPKEYQVVTQKVGSERKQFHKTEEYAEKACHEAVKAGVNITAGVAGGAAVAAAAPTAAMWVATTFGTASTGTAISALSGAAATKAALAWMGGGALSAGGAGMAGGEALLMLAGPVGWMIAGGAVVLSTSVLSIRNKKLADRAAKEEKELKLSAAQLQDTKERVIYLSKKTNILYGNLYKAYDTLQNCQGKDFRELEEEIQFQFGGLVNNTLSLSEMLNKTL